jgi:hypothetical protein
MLVVFHGIPSVIIKSIALCNKSWLSDDNLLLKPSGYFFARVLAGGFAAGGGKTICKSQQRI